MTLVPSITRLTAAGRGAVAVIRVRLPNPGDASLLQQHFLSATGRELTNVTPGLICYGQWNGEGVVLVRTDETEWEIHCHGGDAAVSRIENDLLTTLPDAEIHQGMGTTLEELLLEKLLRCRTQRTANYMLTQHQGAYRDFLSRLVSVESTAEALALITPFLSRHRFATNLTTPLKVAICGLPNAGKSSLLNAVLGYDRAIVYDQPGTTRDRIAAEVIIGGWPFEFLDTAGLRDETNDDIEAAGIAAAREVLAEADICLLVVDSTAGWTSADQDILDSIPDGKHIGIVWNKSDLPETQAYPETGLPPVHPVSALKNTGVTELLDAIAEPMNVDIPDDDPLPVIPEINNILRQFAAEEISLEQLKTAIQKYL